MKTGNSNKNNSTLRRKGSIQNPLGFFVTRKKKFYVEPFGFIHYHLFCPFRIKYFILLTNIKTQKCI